MEHFSASPTRNNQRKIIFASLIGIATLSLAAWYFSDAIFARDWAVYQETADWRGWESRLPSSSNAYELRTNDPLIPLDVRPSILLKSEANLSRLLLKHRYSSRTYVFDSEANSISTSTEENWDAAPGNVTNCWTQLESPDNDFFRSKSYPDYIQAVDGKILPSYGRYAFRANKSPTEKKVAVLSGSGWLRGPGITVIFGLGGADPRISFGQLYLEVLDLETKTRLLSGPFRLKSEVPLDPEGHQPCWSDDEKFVVVYNGDRYISVVGVSG